LNAVNTGGNTATGQATLWDDGSNDKVFESDNESGTPTDSVADDDRPKPVVPEPQPAPVPPAPPTVPEIPATEPAPPQVFDSALKPPALPVEIVAPIGEIFTQRSGFPVVVVEAPTPNLSVFRGITDQFIDGSKPASFSLPADAFAHTKPDATVVLTAKLVDGQDLPAWIRFDPRSGTFQINPPPGLVEELRINVTARDGEGREASSIFRFFIGDGKAKPTGRPSLSEQINLAVKRNNPWLEAVRQQDSLRKMDRPSAEKLPVEKMQLEKLPTARVQTAVQRARV
jgi:hypothetical protein